MQEKKVALQVIEESLKELESPKGSILSAIQKLQRSASIAGDEEKRLWCSIQLGDSTYVHPLSWLSIQTLQQVITRKEFRGISKFWKNLV